MAVRKTNPPFRSGVPELLILHLLAERSMHGYELVQAIGTHTAGGLEFGEGCIYPILHRLESEGMLDGRRHSVGGRSRVVYRVTPKGRRELARSVSDWRRVVAAVNHCLQGGERGQP